MSYLFILVVQHKQYSLCLVNKAQTILTWKIATAFERNNLVSGEAIFPLRTLHLTSKSVGVSGTFSSCFFFMTSRRESGIFSSPRISNFCKAEKILSQSMQQNHFPFGNSCSITSLKFDPEMKQQLSSESVTM